MLDIKFIKEGSLVILVLGPTSVRSIIIYHRLIAIQRKKLKFTLR